MTIENIEAFVKSLPDWAILDGCFQNPRIKPSDIDGWVEKGGLSLFLEHKGPGGEIKQGQAIGFNSLARQGNTVVVYWTDEDNDVTDMQLWTPEQPLQPKRSADLAQLRLVVSTWDRQVSAYRRAA